MNGKLFFVALVATALSACGGRAPRTEIVVEDEVEYKPLVTDSAAIDSIANSGMIDHEAAVEIPDIPKDKSIHMDANDEAVLDIMSGRGDGEIAK